MSSISVNNAPKLIGILVICAMVTLLLLFNRLDSVAGAGVLGTALGYLAGNGIAAKADQPIEPVLTHHDDGDVRWPHEPGNDHNRDDQR